MNINKKIIKNIGKTKTLIYNGQKPPKRNELEWSIDYDNKHGVDLNVNMNNNGDKSHYHQYLTNSEIEELLKIPLVNKPIHERLLNDFNPYNNTIPDFNNNNHLDLITYPRENTQKYDSYDPYNMQNNNNNDLMNYNKLPTFVQTPSESRPKVIKIKIFTKKQKKHSNKNRSKNNRLSSYQETRKSSTQSKRRSNRIR
uniref:Uncharacterized protein n=1 Tax=viral metagenome TaxID=1070528 RepID=A0A6C0E4Z8_9ZZZZ